MRAALAPAYDRVSPADILSPTETAGRDKRPAFYILALPLGAISSSKKASRVRDLGNVWRWRANITGKVALGQRRSEPVRHGFNPRWRRRCPGGFDEPLAGDPAYFPGLGRCAKWSRHGRRRCPEKLSLSFQQIDLGQIAFCISSSLEPLATKQAYILLRIEP